MCLYRIIIFNSIIIYLYRYIHTYTHTRTRARRYRRITMIIAHRLTKRRDAAHTGQHLDPPPLDHRVIYRVQHNTWYYIILYLLLGGVAVQSTRAQWTRIRRKSVKLRVIKTGNIII